MEEERTWFDLTFDQICSGEQLPKGLYIIYYDVNKIPLEEVSNIFKQIQHKLGFKRELIALPTGATLKHFDFEDLIKVKNDFNNLIDEYINRFNSVSYKGEIDEFITRDSKNS